MVMIRSRLQPWLRVRVNGGVSRTETSEGDVADFEREKDFCVLPSEFDGFGALADFTQLP